MNYSRVCGACTAAALLVITSAAKAGDSSLPSGYVSVSVPANSDAFVAVPFVQAPTFDGLITAISPNITVASAHGASADSYYVRVNTGAKKGLWSTISAVPSATQLTLADASIQAALVVGDSVTVYPHQTLSTVFPPAMVGITYIQSVSGSNRNTEILEMDNTSVLQNKSAAATYYYLAGVWRKTGSGADFTNYVLPPDKPFIIRNKNNANPLPFAAAKFVAQELWTGRAIPGSTPNDLYVATTRPVAMTLNELQLGGTAAFRDSASASTRHDEILVFDNAATGQNKSASGTYYYIGGVWRKTGSGLDWSNDPSVLPPGAGFIIRRKTSGPVPPASVDWSVINPVLK